jgi:Ca2+-binding RTX toxin-like protein
VPSAEELAGYAYVAGTEGYDVNDVFKGSNDVNNWFQGLGGDDQINGNSMADLIEGGAGNDQLHGNDGDDLLLGGTGNDDIQANNGADCVEGGDGDDKIQGGNDGDHLHGGAGADVISGDNGDDHIDGDAGNDAIQGGQGVDHIEGGAGNDTIDGGAGNDEIAGGEGNDIISVADGDDTVLYTSVLDGHDVINSFDGKAQGGQDTLNLDALFDALESSLGPLDAATRMSMVQINDTGSTVDISVDMDHNAATAAVQIATLSTSDVITVGEDIIVAA